MITAVLDTNVLASGFVRSNPHAAPTMLLDAWRANRFILLLSTPILTELLRTFCSPYFAQRLTKPQVHAIEELLLAEALVTPLTVHIQGVASHVEDDLILTTAVSGHADYLVTGDAQLQLLGIYAGVQLLSPRSFLTLLPE